MRKKNARDNISIIEDITNDVIKHVPSRAFDWNFCDLCNKKISQTLNINTGHGWGENVYLYKDIRSGIYTGGSHRNCHSYCDFSGWVTCIMQKGKDLHGVMLQK